MDPYRMAVDWSRGVFYIHDNEDPEGIMVFSLETGERLRTIPTPKGEGPYEYPHGRHGMAISANGGLYVSGFLSVIEYDPEGVPASSWRPQMATTSEVCSFGGQPATESLPRWGRSMAIAATDEGAWIGTADRSRDRTG